LSNFSDSENERPRSIVDVGCGIGGSSRYLCKKYDAVNVKGITLSPFQAQRGNQLASDQKLDSKVHIFLFCP
jgi:tocopherol O-methyltransferase